MINSKPLYGHVQEVTPNNGPITVFLEALVGMHTVAVKNVKPINLCDSKLRFIVKFVLYDVNRTAISDSVVKALPTKQI